MMRQHDVIGNRQTEAEAWNLILDRRATIKAFKQTALFLFRYSGAVIGDLKPDSAVAIG